MAIKFFRQLVTDNALSSDERREVLEDLFVFGKENQVPYLVRMSILLVLSTVIATAGLLADSAAVVIGAMLVAPMMNPVMAAGGAVVMGWSPRFYKALWLVLWMSLAAISLASLITYLSPEVVFLPEQVLARTKPTFYDLLVALAAGCAGAYTITRKESSAIPGVAVAVALLPPLASVGVLLVTGDTKLALRALVLFVTNLVSMVLAGALTFMAVGVSPPAVRRQSASFIRNQIGLFAILVLAVSVPLYFYSQKIIFDSEYRAAKSPGLQTWLKKNHLKLVDIDIHDRRRVLYLGLEGPDPPTNIEQLYEVLSNERLSRMQSTEGWKIKYSWTRRVDGTWPPTQGTLEEVAEDDEEKLERLISTPWQWHHTQYDGSRAAQPAEGVTYFVEFDPDGEVHVTAECGTKRGTYKVRGRTIEIEMRMLGWFSCRSDKDLQVFFADLERGTRFFLEDGRLRIRLVTDSGVIYFDEAS